LFGTILLGTDGSETAAKALETAIAIAKQNGSTLHIVNAYRSSSGSGPVVLVGAQVPLDDALEHAVGAEASERLLADVSATASAAGIEVNTHSVNAAPDDAVIDLAVELSANLIVIGNKGMEKRVFGSVPNSIAHKAPCDLLVVKTT
jgi:nucleotide-binding universal stress UspA family protein